MENQPNCNNSEELLSAFIKENEKDGIRVFVAGGSRGGHNPVYVKEAYTLGKKIVEMGFKLDFGLSNSGIMGAVARGVMDAWNEKQHCPAPEFPIQGITTEEYYKLYDSDDIMLKHINVIFAKTLEERKQRLLNADFVVFAPGGVGTFFTISAVFSIICLNFLNPFPIKVFPTRYRLSLLIMILNWKSLSAC